MSYFDDLNEFTDEEIANNGVSSVNDALEGSAAENKKVFDRLPKYIAGRINTIISSLRSFASSIDENITDLKNYIDRTFLYKRDLPTNISSYNNDSGYITAEEVPDNLSSYNNDAGFITEESIPKKVSELENDEKFATEGFVKNYIPDYKAMTLSGDENSGYIEVMNEEHPYLSSLHLFSYKVILEGSYLELNFGNVLNDLKVNTPTEELHCANKGYVDGLVGDIDEALDNILAIQNALISQRVNLAKDGD